MVRTFVACLCLVLLFPLSGCITSGVDLGVSAAWFTPAISGDVALSPTVGGLAPNVDLDADLDLEDVDAAAMGQARFGVLGFNVVANAFQTEQTGRGTLTAGFGDISLGTPVTTDFELLAGQLAVTYNLVDVGILRLAPGVGVEYLDVQLDVRDPLTGVVESIDGAAPVPMVFLDASVSPPMLPIDLQVLVGGIAGSYGDFDGSMFDGLAQINWDAGAGVQVFGGYRMMRFDLDGDEDGQDYEADLDMDGWFLGAGLSF